jgi:hypothetical protein
VAISANKLRDESLGGILCAVYVSATIIFVLFFVSASFLRLLIESEVLASLDNMRSFLQGGKTVSPDVLPDLASIHMALYELIFSRVRLGAIALSLITVPVTVLFRHRYNLGE